MVGLLSLLVAPPPAFGGKAEASAEHTRLQEEMLRLSQKNAWAGVDRTYRLLEDLPVDLTLDDHLFGAEAAMETGDMLTGLLRLQRGLEGELQSSDPASPFQQAKGKIGELQAQYGMVHIVLANDNIVPALFRSPMPFSARERTAISYAQSQLVEEREFMGLLPIGTYRLDVEQIEVIAGQAVQEVHFR